MVGKRDSMCIRLSSIADLKGKKKMIKNPIAQLQQARKKKSHPSNHIISYLISSSCIHLVVANETGQVDREAGNVCP